MSEPDGLVHNAIQIRQVLKLIPVAVLGALDTGSIKFSAQGAKFRGISGKVK
jgi:hypothetical protein